MTNVDDTLAERGKRYGDFDSHSAITQTVKAAMMGLGYGPNGCFNTSYRTNWNTLSPSQREALEMIAHKIGRILNGDPDYADSWHDIAGYAKLVEDKLNEKISHAEDNAFKCSSATQANKYITPKNTIDVKLLMDEEG